MSQHPRASPAAFPSTVDRSRLCLYCDSAEATHTWDMRAHEDILTAAVFVWHGMDDLQAQAGM